MKLGEYEEAGTGKALQVRKGNLQVYVLESVKARWGGCILRHTTRESFCKSETKNVAIVHYTHTTVKTHTTADLF